MLRTLLNGFIFGIGFVTALAIVGYAINKFYPTQKVESSEFVASLNSWNELDIDEKLEQSSAIYILRYSPKEEGLMQAYVSEVHRKSESVQTGAEEGDLRKDSNYYSRGGGMSNRNGAVVFLTDSPARERGTIFLYDNRLAGGSDMPVDILIKKFMASAE